MPLLLQSPGRKEGVRKPIAAGTTGSTFSMGLAATITVLVGATGWLRRDRELRAVTSS